MTEMALEHQDLQKSGVSALNDNEAAKEQKYLEIIAELEEKVAQAEIDSLDKAAALEEAEKEICALKLHQNALEEELRQKRFDELPENVYTRKKTIISIKEPLQEITGGLQRFRPFNKAFVRRGAKRLIPEFFSHYQVESRACTEVR